MPLSALALPPVIAAYFAADAARDGAALCALFAPTARVQDEGQTHIGPDAIGQWWSAAQAKYHHSATPLKLEKDGDHTVISARVTGNFPASPAMLRFAFAISETRITSLRISA